MSTNNTTLLITALVEGLQSIEDAYQQLGTERSIYTSVGTQLDQIGVKVGEPDRNGDDDDIYRRRVWARISTNRSDGLVEDLITVAKLILNDPAVYIHAEGQQPATMVINLEEATVSEEVANLLLAFLIDSVAGGVKIILEYGSTPFIEWFAFDGGPGFDDDGSFITALTEATVLD